MRLEMLARCLSTISCGCCISMQVAAQASGRQGSSTAPGQYSKYSLDAPQPAFSGMAGEAEDSAISDKEANGVGQADSSAPRRHLSAAERKALRKVASSGCNRQCDSVLDRTLAQTCFC